MLYIVTWPPIFGHLQGFPCSFLCIIEHIAPLVISNLNFRQKRLLGRSAQIPCTLASIGSIFHRSDGVVDEDEVVLEFTVGGDVAQHFLLEEIAEVQIENGGIKSLKRFSVDVWKFQEIKVPDLP